MAPITVTTVGQTRRALVTVATATHLGHALSPVDAALVIRAQVATTGHRDASTVGLDDVALRMLRRITDESGLFVSLTMASGEAA